MVSEDYHETGFFDLISELTQSSRIQDGVTMKWGWKGIVHSSREPNGFWR